MLLKSIKLVNFRQYRGPQTIDFSCDAAHNVTVILGVNTSGKTTLIQALNWAFYGQTTFKSKDLLLNMDVAYEMNLQDAETVVVEVCLTHDHTDYILTTSQEHRCDTKGKIRPDIIKRKLSYKSVDGQTENIRTPFIDNTINKILPEELSSYFFFDGERIENISSKQDVTEAVKGLLGLTVLDQAMTHLDPKKPRSVIGKFNSSLDLGGSQKAAEAQRHIQQYQEHLQTISEDMAKVNEEIKYFETQKTAVETTLKDNQVTAEAQRAKERWERAIQREEQSLDRAYTQFRETFNTNAALFFARPLMTRVLTLLKESRIESKGIPNMNATSIDFILKRGRCICGAEIHPGSDSYDHLLAEREYLPPQSIGTVLRNFKDHVTRYNASIESFSTSVQESYKNIYQHKLNIAEWEEEVRTLSQKIQGTLDMQKYETDLQAIKRRIKQAHEKRDGLLQDQGATRKDIERNEKLYESLVAATAKNQQILLYKKYSDAAYEWIRKTYVAREAEIREQLEQTVNRIFAQMYHGHRKVMIDSRYHVSLLTNVGTDSLITDESRGLETVKNFAFIAGLVDLARTKVANTLGPNDDPLATEPYPLVMDAPFSNADEHHVGSISKILPMIAEQVIMVVMEKDWKYAEQTLGERVGKKYVLDKKSETLTYIEEVSVHV